MLTTRFVNGAPNWRDIGTSDIDRASACYGALFGWRYFTFSKWQELFPFVPLTLDYMVVVQTIGWLAVIGMGLGAFGSLLSVRKHIRLAVE